MRNVPLIAASIAVVGAMLACTLPSGGGVTAAATAFSQTQTAEAGAPPSATPEGAATSEVPTPTNTVAAAPTACFPIVTANLNANVREGDSTDYEIVGFLATGNTAPLMGRNAADTWWYIQHGGGHGWIAKSVTTASCLPASVAVVEPPPLPPTAVPAPDEFAVTSVNYSFSEASYGGHSDCPMMTANITANGPGMVTYKWLRSDGANAPTQSINFGAAGTQAVTTNWALGSIWEGTEHWLGIYIDDPNHQEFGHKTFTDACDG